MTLRRGWEKPLVPPGDLAERGWSTRIFLSEAPEARAPGVQSGAQTPLIHWTLAARATPLEPLRDLGPFVWIYWRGKRCRLHGLHANDEDLCRARSEPKAQTQRGFLRSSPKGQGLENPFHLARGWREGRGEGGSGPGSASPRPGAADGPAPQLDCQRPCGRRGRRRRAGEWGRPFPAPQRPRGRSQSPGDPEAPAWWRRGRLWGLPGPGRLVCGGDCAGRGPGPREEGPQTGQALSFPYSRLVPAHTAHLRWDCLPARPLSAASLARNVDPRPGKSRSSPTPPRHLPSWLGPRLRARAWPEARAKKLADLEQPRQSGLCGWRTSR